MKLPIFKYRKMGTGTTSKYGTQKLLLFCIVSCILFAASCHKDKKESCYRDYTAADIAQLVYLNPDTLLFKSNLGYTDTIQVGNIYEDILTDASGCPDKRTQKSVHFFFIDSVFQNYGGNNISIKKPLKNAGLPPPEFEFSANIVGWGSSTSMVINGKTVNNVYPISAPAGHYLSKIYWTYTYGIIRVDHSNGRVWERIDF